MHKLPLPIQDHVLDTYLHENATGESHKQSHGALGAGHNLTLDEPRRNKSQSPYGYQGEQALGEK